MRLTDWLLGRPLASSDSEENKVTVWAGIPLLGLDALSSAAYGPEAAMTILLPLGVLGLTNVLPIIGVIVVLLAILYFSYRQTIHSYPNGGGSYIVAKANLGTTAGLFAAAALMLDYILTVAVGISAGVGALISAVPSLHKYTLSLCIVILILITLVNLRGVKEAGGAFLVPTYLFIVSLLGVLAYGLFRAFMAGGHPHPFEPPSLIPVATQTVAPWLLVRAFASGCTAMTGVEAVSNGIQAFAKPRVDQAQRTLTAIVGILAVMLLGIGILCRIYGVGATDPDSASYQSVLSQLIAAIVGRGAIYYVTIFSIITVLALSANTAFSDFPRLCHLIAEDDFLPRFFALRGRRLVYSSGIIILAIFCGVLLAAFGGITDRLIPLYAIGAFLAFTLSQTGMVMHWRRNKEKGWRTSLAINGVGAVSTAIALAVVLVAKFVEGAWITVLLIPILVLLFRRVAHHYARVEREIACLEPIDMYPTDKLIALVPLKEWSLVSQKAIRFALSLTDEVCAFHIDSDEGDPDNLEPGWTDLVVKPLQAAGRPVPDLVRVQSPYRRFIMPTLDYVKSLSAANPGKTIVVIVPQLIETGAFQWLLHNQRANLLKTALMFRGGSSVVVANVPWYLEEPQ